MAKRVVQLKLSELIADLQNGLPWYASEDEGFGSIQGKLGCETEDIDDIRQHPKLQGAEPASFIEFQIIDDLDDNTGKENKQDPATVINGPDSPAVVATNDPFELGSAGATANFELNTPAKKDDEAADFMNLI